MVVCPLLDAARVYEPSTSSKATKRHGNYAGLRINNFRREYPQVNAKLALVSIH
jgi:hypothetical protein